MAGVWPTVIFLHWY